MTFSLKITLFLYGIGADRLSPNAVLPIADYIIPIWNWSFVILYIGLSLLFYYIIPIWNWSKNSSTIESTLELLHYSYMELELFLLKELKEF